MRHLLPCFPNILIRKTAYAAFFNAGHKAFIFHARCDNGDIVCFKIWLAFCFTIFMFLTDFYGCNVLSADRENLA